jgi:multidrug resistance protein, MATE family
MNYKTHVKETIRLAVPISLGQLGHMMLGVIDSVMVGRVGSVPLAAASLVNGLFFLVLVFGIGMTVASTPLIAIAKGSGRYSDCGKTLNHSLLINIFFSFFMAIAILLISFIIPYLNQPREVVIEAVPYLRVLTLSIIPFMLFQCYRQFLEGLSLPNPPMIIAVFANMLHFFLNWIFIYGKFGFKAYGLFGAGVATMFTRCVMAGILMIFVLNYKKVRIYKPRPDFGPLDFSLIKKLMEIGLPSGFQGLLEVSAFAFAAIMIGWLGSIQLAAHQIAISLASATYMIMLGISYAGTIRVGTAFGRRDRVGMRRAGFSAMGLAFLLMLCFGMILVLLRNYLPSLYVGEDKVVKIASQLLIIAALFQIFDGLQASGLGVLRGLTDAKIPMIISFGAYWLVMIPVSFILGFYCKMNVAGIWIGFLIGLALLGITMLIRFNSKSKSVTFS